jgi:ABC-type antimicrobial peptide transport system permease subunit
MRLDRAALQSLAGGSLPVGDRIEPMRVADVAEGASSLLTLQSGVLLHPATCADFYWSGAGGGALIQYRVLGSFPGLNVVAASADSVAAVSERLESSGLYVWSARSIQSQLQQFTRLIEVGLSILGLIGLLISALGLANTILMNVMERRADIGIMRTVGARRQHVAGQFVTQGALMGIVFGVVGIASGTTLMVLAEFALNETVFSGLNVNLFKLSVGQGLAMTVGASLFCAAVAILPARQAARVDPAQAVRLAR